MPIVRHQEGLPNGMNEHAFSVAFDFSGRDHATGKKNHNRAIISISRHRHHKSEVRNASLPNAANSDRHIEYSCHNSGHTTEAWHLFAQTQQYASRPSRPPLCGGRTPRLAARCSATLAPCSALPSPARQGPHLRLARSPTPTWRYLHRRSGLLRAILTCTRTS